MKIAERIEKYCEDNAISRHEFAEKVGMTEVSLSRIITGKRFPQAMYLKNMAFLFKITLDELLEDEFPSEELISRQAALDILEEYSKDVIEVRGGAYGRARKAMIDLPAAKERG